MTTKIAGTFSALAKCADFSARVPSNDPAPREKVNGAPDKLGETPALPPKQLRSEFHFNIQIHLPSNGTEGRI